LIQSVKVMKTNVVLPVVSSLILAGSLAFAQGKRLRTNQQFMRGKLDLSQKVLEGLATEDYALIIAKASRLGDMSREADWRVFETPEYEQQSIQFQRQVSSLVRAAKEKNLDSATLAYVRVTMSCVDCHKLVRGKLSASYRPDAQRTADLPINWGSTGQKG